MLEPFGEQCVVDFRMPARVEGLVGNQLGIPVGVLLQQIATDNIYALFISIDQSLYGIWWEFIVRIEKHYPRASGSQATFVS